MSYDTSTMIGPYMVITETPVETIEKKEKKVTCTNDACEKHGFTVAGNFCNNCGCEVKEITFTSFTKKEIMHFDQVKYDYGNEDIFYKPDYINAYIPNLNYDGCLSIWIDDENAIVEEIPRAEEAIAALVNSKEYKSFFEYITKLGYKYEIKFGVVSYTS